jgi:hypothetical protein
VQAYANVVALFQQNLASGQASVASATQDLLLLLLPHLARTNAAAFLQLVLTSGALTHANGGVQKRAQYKALSRVLELADPPVPADARALLATLDRAGLALAYTSDEPSTGHAPARPSRADARELLCGTCPRGSTRYATTRPCGSTRCRRDIRRLPSLRRGTPKQLDMVSARGA